MTALPLHPCPLVSAHDAHERTTGKLPAWCPGKAPSWPGEPVIGADDAEAVEHRRFAGERPGPAVAHVRTEKP